MKVKDVRIEKIKRRWLDDMGIGHPILEEELQDDIRYLVELVEKPEEIKED